MSVRILPNGKFVIDYYPQGRKGPRRQWTLPAVVTTIEQARLIEQDFKRASQTEKAPVDTERATIADLVPTFLADRELHAGSPETYRDMRGVFTNWILTHLGRLRPMELTSGHTDTYKRLRKTTGVSERTVNKELSYFSTFLTYLRDEQQIPVPEFRIKHFKYHPPKPMPLTLPEIFAFLKWCEPLYRAFFVFVFTTGCRFNEARHVVWEDLDLHARMVILRRTKGGKQRIVPLSKLGLWALQQIKPASAAGLVFRSRITGGPIVDVRRAIARAKDAAGIDKRVTTHILRHSFASALTARNYNLKKTQLWLGHQKESTTADLYAHVEPEALRDAEEVLQLPSKLPLTTPRPRKIRAQTGRSLHKPSQIRARRRAREDS